MLAGSLLVRFAAADFTGLRVRVDLFLPELKILSQPGGLILSVILLSTGGGPVLTQVLIAGVVTAMGAGSAAGSLVLARRGSDKDSLTASEPTGMIEGE